MSGVLRACLGCGEPSDGSRCPTCKAERDKRIGQQRGNSHQRGYTMTWRRTAALVKRRQPACQVCGTTADPTADHIVSKAAGGTDDIDNLQTLCRKHNGQKGAR